MINLLRNLQIEDASPSKESCSWILNTAPQKAHFQKPTETPNYVQRIVAHHILPQLFSLISLPNWKQFKKDNGDQKEATIVEEEFKQVCWNSEFA
jgi:hypothetical protein